MADTRGRTRAAKRRAEKLMKESIRMEEEVDFHPRYEDDVSCFNNFHTDSSAEEASDAPTHASTVASTISMNQSNRDGALIAAASPAGVTSMPKPRTPTESHQTDRLPPPCRLRAQADRKGNIERMLQEERFKTNPTNGKAYLLPDIFMETPLPKPYMYINMEGCQNLKQKLDVRASLSPMEYVNATLALVNDHRAYHAND